MRETQDCAALQWADGMRMVRALALGMRSAGNCRYEYGSEDHCNKGKGEKAQGCGQAEHVGLRNTGKVLRRLGGI